jgi:hypothetical protein
MNTNSRKKGAIRVLCCAVLCCAVLCCAVLCCAVKIISLTAMPVHLRCNISILFRIAEMSGFINHFNLIL